MYSRVHRPICKCVASMINICLHVPLHVCFSQNGIETRLGWQLSPLVFHAYKDYSVLTYAIAIENVFACLQWQKMASKFKPNSKHLILDIDKWPTSPASVYITLSDIGAPSNWFSYGEFEIPFRSARKMKMQNCWSYFGFILTEYIIWIRWFDLLVLNICLFTSFVFISR